jgi:hypothetical protein
MGDRSDIRGECSGDQSSGAALVVWCGYAHMPTEVVSAKHKPMNRAVTVWNPACQTNPHMHVHEHDNSDSLLAHARHIVVAQVSPLTYTLPCWVVQHHFVAEDSKFPFHGCHRCSSYKSVRACSLTVEVSWLVHCDFLQVFEFGVVAHSIIIGVTIDRIAPAPSSSCLLLSPSTHY